MSGTGLMQHTAQDPRFETPPDDRFEPPDRRREREGLARRRRRGWLWFTALSLASLAVMIWGRSAERKAATGLLIPIIGIVLGLLELVLKAVASNADDEGPYSSPPSITR